MLNIRVARVRKGLSQIELARALGVSLTTVSAWECGRHKLTIENLIKLADILDCSIDFLVGRKENFN